MDCIQCMVSCICPCDLCCCLKPILRLFSVKATRNEIMKKFKTVKHGVWVHDDDLKDTEWPYDPLPEEKELMDEIEYDLQHGLNNA